MRHSIASLSLGLLAIACAPDLPPFESAACGGSAPNDETSLSLRLDPPAPAEAAPTAAWLIVEAAAGGLAAEDFHLFTGEIRDGHLAQLARGEMSKALEERLVPTLGWSDETGRVTLAPLVLLEPGASYAVATGDPRWAAPLIVSEDDAVPTLSLVFPPDGRSAAAPFGIWCGEEPLPPFDETLALAPDGALGLMATGAVPGAGAHCLRVMTDARPGPVVVPPAITTADGTLVARLEPAALEESAARTWPPALVCSDAEHPVGGACLEIFDDRARLRSPAEPLFWVANGPPGLDATRFTRGFATWISPLPPSSPITLELTRIDIGGRPQVSTLSVTTLPPAPHLVITEVYANAVGPEPQQEWVEIYNDGLAPAQLEGWVVADIGGPSALPAVVLEPGTHALVVREDFDEAFAYDPPLAPGALVIRVPELGKNGLSNSGEPLELRSPDGAVISRFPPSPKPAAGASIVRIDPRAADDDPASFVRSETPTPGGP